MSKTTSMRPGSFYIDDNVYDLSAVKNADVESIGNWEKKYAEMSVGQPFAVSVKLDAQDAEDACKAVLKGAGASKKRDAIDARIVKEVKKGTATYKGSVTGLPGIIDSENDVL